MELIRIRSGFQLTDLVTTPLNNASEQMYRNPYDPYLWDAIISQYPFIRGLSTTRKRAMKKAISDKNHGDSKSNPNTRAYSPTSRAAFQCTARSRKLVLLDPRLWEVSTDSLSLAPHNLLKKSCQMLRLREFILLAPRRDAQRHSSLFQVCRNTWTLESTLSNNR